IALATNDLPVNPHYITQVLDQGEVRLLHRSRWFNAITVELQDSTVLAAIEALDCVRSFRKVGRSARPVRDVVKFGDTYEMAGKQQFFESPDSMAYGPSYFQIDMIAVNELHRLGYFGAGLTIAVLDAGFRRIEEMAVFDQVRARGGLLGQRDFVDGTLDSIGNGSHGTWVWSVMAGDLPGSLIGTAPQANYWLLRTEQGRTEFVVEEHNWVAAAEFADSAGVDIINSSLGYTTFQDTTQDHTYADLDGNTTWVTRGADVAASKGILVVNSAGNSGASAWKYLVAPSDGDSVMAVGAVGRDGVPAGFTSHGPSSDGRVKPNVAAMGANTVVARIPEGIFNANGTSFSSPLIAGAAACLWQANPTRTNMEILRAIEASAHRFTNPDTLWGHGIPNFRKAYEALFDFEVFEPDPITIFPNPSSEAIAVEYYAETSSTVQLEVFDLRGRSIYQQEVSAVIGKNQWILPATLPGNGTYVLAIEQDGEAYRKPFLRTQTR
ncbi:MAG: S8 family serine peptidase, partial [Bacteroidota bacterium]